MLSGFTLLSVALVVVTYLWSLGAVDDPTICEANPEQKAIYHLLTHDLDPNPNWYGQITVYCSAPRQNCLPIYLSWPQTTRYVQAKLSDWLISLSNIIS